MEHLKEVVQLIYKYLREELPPEEELRLQNWIAESGEHKIFYERATNKKLLLENARSKADNLKNIDLDKEWQRLKEMERKQSATKIIAFKWRRYAIAASLLVVTVTGAYMWLKTDKQPPEIVSENKPNIIDVLPNTTNAVLTTDDGTTIVLDSTQTGTLIDLGNVQVTRMEDGRIVYNAAVKQGAAEGMYNTITAPMGSDVVFVTLSDGSKVWMNAASSIRYPIVFTGNKREVSISGEAYFEIAHNASKPFYVSKGAMQVQVVGTHFNVNSYEDDGAIKITLLEGSVKVTNKDKSVFIKPGEQAIAKTITNEQTPLSINRSPNMEEVMAWKNGRFVFKNTKLEIIMAQIERWYNVEVIYEGDIKQQGITLTGKISRYSKASELLDLLGETEWLQFTIEGKKIIVKHKGK